MAFWTKFVQKVFNFFSSGEESGKSGGVKRKFCEMGVGTEEDLHQDILPPKKVSYSPQNPEISPTSSNTTTEMRRKCCTNFNDLVEFGEAFGLPTPTLVSEATVVATPPAKMTTSTPANTTSTSTPTSVSPTITSETATTPPTDTATSSPTTVEEAAKKKKAEEDKKAEDEKKAEEEFIKTHEVHVIEPEQVSTNPENSDPAQTSAATPPSPPISFSSPFLQNYDFDNQIEFLRKNLINPIKARDLYKSADILLPRGLYFYGVDINSTALTLTKALATELGKEVGEGGKPLRIFRRTSADSYSKYSCDEGGEKFCKMLFSVAIKNKPSIIFIEDLDKFGGYCTYNISTNDKLIKALGSQMDALISGEVFVIATIPSKTQTFVGLNSGQRFTKWLEFPSTISTKGILGCLRIVTEKWKISEGPEASQTSRDSVLSQATTLLSGSGVTLKCDDITTLCQEIYQTTINDLIHSSTASGDKSCCSCCKCPPTAPPFPGWSQWEKGIQEFLKAKKTVAPGKSGSLDVTSVQTDKGMETLSFSKIGGLAQQIELLTENIITPLRNKKKLKELGWEVEPVRGIIFHGPPGTGKTLLGKTLAAELGRLDEAAGGKKFAFFYHKGTDCYTKWVGDTEAKLRAIFANAEANKPAIIFMDEIDGLCSARDENASISKFYNGVVTTMLGLMDNLPRGEVFVIAATNRLSVLDPALRRPGRFDKCVEFQAPKLEGRKSILEIHTASWDTKSKMEASFLEEMAQKTGSYTGADLEQLCRQAFVFAMRRHSKSHDSKENSDFDGLVIQKEDWYGALKSVRPSGSNHFGNAVITDKPIPAGAAAALKGKVEEITKKLGDFMTKDAMSDGNGTLNTFLIWGSDAKQLKVIDNLLIPSLFGSPAFRDTVAAKFDIPPLGVGSEVVQKHVSSTFNHVLNPGEDKLGILYIPGIDALLNVGMNKVWKMKEHDQILDHLEILRGEKVLLVGSATGPPDRMNDKVQVLFRGLKNAKHYEMTAPNETEIRQVFESVSAKIKPVIFDKIIAKLSRSSPHTSSKVDGNNARKNMNLYELLDFVGEVSQLISQFETKSDQEKIEDEIDVTLEKATDAFCAYLDGQEKYKSSLCGMYT